MKSVSKVYKVELRDEVTDEIKESYGEKEYQDSELVINHLRAQVRMKDRKLKQKLLDKEEEKER